MDYIKKYQKGSTIKKDFSPNKTDVKTLSELELKESGYKPIKGLTSNQFFQIAPGLKKDKLSEQAEKIFQHNRAVEKLNKAMINKYPDYADILIKAPTVGNWEDRRTYADQHAKTKDYYLTDEEMSEAGIDKGEYSNRLTWLAKNMPGRYQIKGTGDNPFAFGIRSGLNTPAARLTHHQKGTDGYVADYVYKPNEQGEPVVELQNLKVAPDSYLSKKFLKGNVPGLEKGGKADKKATTVIIKSIMPGFMGKRPCFKQGGKIVPDAFAKWRK